MQYAPEQNVAQKMWVLNWLLMWTNGGILWIMLWTFVLDGRKSLERNNYYTTERLNSFIKIACNRNQRNAWKPYVSVNQLTQLAYSLPARRPATVTFLSGPFPASKLLKRFRKSPLPQTACHLFATDGPNYWIQRHYGLLLARCNEWITHFKWSSRITHILQCVRWEVINRGLPSFLWHRATPVTVGWFVVRTCKTNNVVYVTAKLFRHLYIVFRIYKWGAEVITQPGGMRLETHGIYLTVAHVHYKCVGDTEITISDIIYEY